MHRIVSRDHVAGLRSDSGGMPGGLRARRGVQWGSSLERKAEVLCETTWAANPPAGGSGRCRVPDRGHGRDSSVRGRATDDVQRDTRRELLLQLHHAEYDVLTALEDGR